MNIALSAPYRPHQSNFRLKAASTVAALAFLLNAPTSHAGTNEVKFLVQQLSGVYSTNTSAITLASASDLAAAVAQILTDIPAYNNPAKPTLAATLVGEALRYSGDPDAGLAIANAIKTLPVVTPNAQTFLVNAVKTAGKGAVINLTGVPDFSAALLNLNATSQTTAIAAASAASATKPGAAAILAGQAEQFTADSAGDTSRESLFAAAIVQSKLKAAIQDIARSIGSSSADSAVFANDIATANAASATNVLKIAAGVAAGAPTNAGQITATLFANNSLAVNLRKNVATYVKNVSIVSNIEQIPLIAKTIGQQIAAGGIAISKGNSLLTTMVKSILTAPAAGSLNPTANRKDEATEVAANLVANMALALTTQITDPAKAAKTVVSLMASASKAFSNAGLGLSPAQISADVAASVVLTIQNSTVPALAAVKTALQALFSPATAATTAKGIDSKNTAAIIQAVTDAYAGTNINRFEDGNASLLANVIDPETDDHPF